MTAPVTPADVLAAAAAILREPGAWCQHGYALGDNRGQHLHWSDPAARSWCIGSAITLAAGRLTGAYVAGNGCLAWSAVAWFNSVHGVRSTAQFNDRRGMTQAGAVGALELAGAAWQLAHPDRPLTDAVEAFKQALFDALPARVRGLFR